ncbi:hypothetical protein BABINDRAFT_165616 [Babjeviella inositovora NRRL Y-12698]|uniref:Mitochondrial fission 1 protein n=1 Tax=Babjeviella inositovora NRRL Y-12698 TaxID=984486 RepID=A0A1E3QYH4_9ASCO|nr:uncharacterized protein BABINDRAFT_165616 [Babjeviella inositovora NRRL Y-12698]ODQ82127.1 hypothetical protein BABINDRAFT_165616 [Babjeviella inositovora NRRL Y-12698]
MSKLSYLPALEDANTPLSKEQLTILRNQLSKEQPNISIQSQFNYAWGLIKSALKDDSKQGIRLLSEIYKEYPQRRRECLYYLSIGCYKVGDYSNARRYAEALLENEPENTQAQQLKNLIEDKVAKEGLIGMAVIGGFLAVGGAALTAILTSKKSRR